MNPSTVTQSNTSTFDPNQDIDVSNIGIIDTSKGDSIDYSSLPSNEIYSYKCLNCNYRYEGVEKITKCPKCGSENIVDL